MSISSMFFTKLLQEQIPKAKKIQSSCLSFFALLGSAYVKAARRMLMKLTPNYNVTISLEYQITQLTLLWNNCGYILFTCCRFWWCKSAFSGHKTYAFSILIILPLLCTQNFQFLLLRVLFFFKLPNPARSWAQSYKPFFFGLNL